MTAFVIRTYVAHILLCVRMSHVYVISHHGAASVLYELDFFTSRQSFFAVI